MPLITAAQFREHFPALIGTGEDTLLGTLVDRADGLMASHCGWPHPGTPSAPLALTMVTASYTESFNGPTSDDPRRINLGHPWVTAITSASLDPVGDWSYTTAIPSGDLVLDACSAALYLKPSSTYGWVESSRAQLVVYQAGFVTTPPDLVAACAMLVRHLLALRRVNPGETAASRGDQSVVRADVDALIPVAIRRALAHYTNWGARAG